MGRLELTLGEVHHVEHIGREAETITELLNGNGRGDSHDIGRQPDAQVHETEAGERHTSSHPPHGFLQTYSRGKNTAKDTAQHQECYADSTVSNTYRLRRERQSSCLVGGHKERVDHLNQKSFRQTINQHEYHSQKNTRLLEIRDERAAKLCKNSLRRLRLAFQTGFVGSRFGHEEDVPQCNQAK